MGWRERDYAKFTDQEFAAIYGGGRRSGGPPPASRAVPPSSGAAPVARRRRRSGRPYSSLGRVIKVVTVALAGTAAFFTFLVVTGQVEALDHFMNSQTLSSPIGPNAPAVPSAPLRIENPPTKAMRQVGLITGTRLLHAGTTLRLHGTHPPESGSIVIRGRWNSSARWVTYGVARGSARSYALAVPLAQRGVLHLRIDYPDGHHAVGTYQVD